MSWFDQGSELVNAGSLPYSWPSWFNSPGSSPIVNGGGGQPGGAPSPGAPLVPYQAPWWGGGGGSSDANSGPPSVSFADMTGPQQAATQSLNNNPMTGFFSSLLSGNLPGAIGSIPGALGLDLGGPQMGPVSLNSMLGMGLGRAAAMAGVPGFTNPAAFITSLAKLGMNMNGQFNLADSMHNDTMQGFGPNDATPSFSMPGTDAQGLGIEGLAPSPFSPTFNMQSLLSTLSPMARIALAQMVTEGLGGRGAPGSPAGGFGLTGQEGMTSLNADGSFGPSADAFDASGTSSPTGTGTPGAPGDSSGPGSNGPGDGPGSAGGGTGDAGD